MAMRVADGCAYPEGALTLAEARAALAEGVEALAQGAGAFDLAGVTQVDSSALSLLLSWRRAAQAQSRPLAYRNVPDSLLSLAALYGLTDLVI
jgi:phospholipid transport system transporter-binding protein